MSSLPSSVATTGPPSRSRRLSSCKSQSTSATHKSGCNSCSGCRGRGCRRVCPCCGGGVWRRGGRRLRLQDGTVGRSDCRTIGSRSHTVKPCDLGNPHQRDDNLRLLVPALHVRVEIRPASDEHPVWTGVALHTKRLGDGLRLQVSERWQTQHQC